MDGVQQEQQLPRLAVAQYSEGSRSRWTPLQ